MSTRRPFRDSEIAARLPACPEHLQGEARKESRRTGKRLLACGLVTAIDTAALAAYCTAWARWVDAEQHLARFGVVIKSPNGYPVQSPYLAIANKAMEQLMKALTEFGMSPSSRARVAVAQARELPQPRYEEPEYDPREVLRAVR
jgi:P27 family predicted phage terminase small subunit